MGINKKLTSSGVLFAQAASLGQPAPTKPLATLAVQSLAIASLNSTATSPYLTPPHHNLHLLLFYAVLCYPQVQQLTEHIGYGYGSIASFILAAYLVQFKCRHTPSTPIANPSRASHHPCKFDTCTSTKKRILTKKVRTKASFELANFSVSEPRKRSLVGPQTCEKTEQSVDMNEYLIRMRDIPSIKSKANES